MGQNGGSEARQFTCASSFLLVASFSCLSFHMGHPVDLGGRRITPYHCRVCKRSSRRNGKRVPGRRRTLRADSGCRDGAAPCAERSLPGPLKTLPIRSPPPRRASPRHNGGLSMRGKEELLSSLALALRRSPLNSPPSNAVDPSLTSVRPMAAQLLPPRSVQSQCGSPPAKLADTPRGKKKIAQE